MILHHSVNGFGRALRRASRPGLVAPAMASALAATLAVGLPMTARAQLAVDHVEAVLRPNARSEREVVINVKNEGDKTVQAVVRLEDWERTADGTNHWFPLGTRTGTCGKALSIFPLTVSLDAGASQSIRVSLDSTLSPASECWSAAVVETVQPVLRQGQQVGYVLRTAVKLYVQPVGLRADGDITDLRVVDDSAAATASDSARHIEVEFENTGDRHVVAQGALEFRRPDNTVAARVPLPTLYTLPGAKQYVKATMPRLEAGRYVMLATLDFGGNEIAAAQIEYEVVR